MGKPKKVVETRLAVAAKKEEEKGKVQAEEQVELDQEEALEFPCSDESDDEGMVDLDDF